MSKRRWLVAVLLLSVASVSSSSQAEQTIADHDDIIITSNKHFDRAHGVRSGRGTTSDPFVISRWNVQNIVILNTSKAVRITGNIIENLTLNYAGPRFTVRDNHIGDLRVNENVARTGAPTSGSFVRNTIGVVGQIRHFDGHFAYNTVGTPSGGTLDLGTARAVNFDGFNGAMFHHNTIHGFVDVRLHGHHHSSGFGDNSHMHSAHHEHDMVDHTKRYHDVTVSNNTIYSTGSYGLAYLDTNHAGNDRTATSETNRDLNMPHVHRTRVAFRDNRLVGAGILVDVFNATDELHKTFATGSLSITGNAISLEEDDLPFSSKTGIQVAEARHLALRIASNTISGFEPDPTLAMMDPGCTGLLLGRIDAAKITVEDLTVRTASVAIYATDMTQSVTWTIRRLRTRDVDQRVFYDSSVENDPVVR